MLPSSINESVQTKQTIEQESKREMERFHLEANTNTAFKQTQKKTKID